MTRAGILSLALVALGATACSGDAPVAAPGAAPYGWDGIGDAVFGMNSSELRQAWPGGLQGPSGKATCFELVPVAREGGPVVRLMIEDDKFVRYSVEGAAAAAPGGGKVGMRVGALAELYPRMSSEPHKYVQGGRYLEVEGKGDRVLVFETDASGTVTTWRVGEMPQVAYVEGCG